MCEEEEDETGFVRDALRNCEANWQIWGFEGGRRHGKGDKGADRVC